MRRKTYEEKYAEFINFDYSRYYIPTLDELLKINGGGEASADDWYGSDSPDDCWDSDSDSGDSFSDEDENSAGESNKMAEQIHSLNDADRNIENGMTEGANENAKTNGNAIAQFQIGKNMDGEARKGLRINNTHAAVANARLGDTVQRNDKTVVTITQADIDWAQKWCDEHGINWNCENEEEYREFPKFTENDSVVNCGENVKNTDIYKRSNYDDAFKNIIKDIGAELFESLVGTLGNVSLVFSDITQDSRYMQRFSKNLRSLSDNLGKTSFLIDFFQNIKEPSLKNSRNLTVSGISMMDSHLGLLLQTYCSYQDAVNSYFSSLSAKYSDLFDNGMIAAPGGF